MDLREHDARYLQLNPCLLSGSDRTRTPVAANSAFEIAGMIGGNNVRGRWALRFDDVLSIYGAIEETNDLSDELTAKLDEELKRFLTLFNVEEDTGLV